MRLGRARDWGAHETGAHTRLGRARHWGVHETGARTRLGRARDWGALARRTERAEDGKVSYGGDANDGSHAESRGGGH